MPSRIVDAGLLAAALLLVACSRPPDAAAPAADDATAAAAIEAPPADEPEEVVPPATAPPRTAEAGPLPAEGTIGFAGFGPAAFGTGEEAVRMAWGRELSGAPDASGGCYVLAPQAAGGPSGVAFMLEQDRFVRIDVRSPAVTAPGGGRVGMEADAIRALYGGRVQAMPHKYEQGAQYLRVAAPEGGAAALLFETGADGRVATWRIGLPPQVDYVEGCG